MKIPRRALVLLTALAAALAPGAVAAETAQASRAVTSMASMGDSITRGFNACGFYVDCPSRSWSTGSSSSVHSHYRRLQEAGADPVAHNVGRSGAKVADLQGQAERAVAAGAGYVTVLIGANDACTSSEAGMTSVADFEARFRTAMRTLADGLPEATVLVASIPDIRRLWEVGKGSSSARAAWAALNICQSMLARPRSTDQADVERRERVRQRVADFNAVLARVCAEQAGCRYDGGAVFGYPFELSHMSRWDYFHPNTAGQRLLAEVTYPLAGLEG
ncbi:lipoprotein [Planomonospora parontospora subsp. parontospora]|uniref:Lipoprotein n=2 Tax=Planomonospora parontospora TaxID=58119 RepID=A0AA37F6H6_9ACTN|nr:GDSL-type esterase/lipase family protein [Planomonospora parontospora]GGK82156.1 lipoprotein [Planomonospora parontospora]GII10976.1 lipoprotein [Planomonospora parontospora subsp. parontospora]